MKKILNILLKILAGIIIIPILFFSIFGIIRLFACGPDREVVKVASPVAKIIADDILKNGIPKSLKDIEGLPYALEGCVRQEEYLGENRKPISKEKSYYMIINDKCYFKKNSKKYAIEYLFSSNYHNTLTIFNGKTSTGIDYYFNYSKEINRFVLSKEFDKNPRIYDGKTSGVCSTFRQ